MPSISESSLRQRALSGRLCVVHSGKVYDVTDFAEKHPGGLELLREHSGKDVTELMQESNPHKHSKAAYTILNKYYIGDVGSTDSQTQNGHVFNDLSKDDLVDWSKPLFCQVPELGERYFDWVHQPVDTQIRLFSADWMETCSTAPWWLVPIVWTPVFCFFVLRSFQNLCVQEDRWLSWLGGGFMVGPMAVPLLVFLGLLGWTLAEYVIHRWLFHMRPPGNNRILIALHFILHGQHHKSPMDKRRLVFPPIPASAFAFLLYSLYLTLFPLATSQAVFAGTILGYMGYDLTHYYLHHGTPFCAYFRNLKRYHVLHHFEEQQKGFGISSKLWDYPFGTVIKQ